MSFDSLLINKCTVKRWTDGSPDEYGNPARVPVVPDPYIDEPCRLTTPTGREIMVGAQVVIADYLIFLGDVDITEQDRLEIGSTPFEVLLIADRQDGIGSHHKECFVRTVR